MQTHLNSHDPDMGRHDQESVVDNYTADSIKLSPASIEVWVKRHYMACTLPHHWSWDKTLWSRPYNEIVTFLEGRFENTSDEVEYYKIMPYLRKLIPDSELYVPFRDSPQYRRDIRMECINPNENPLISSCYIAKSHDYMPVKGVKNYGH